MTSFFKVGGSNKSFIHWLYDIYIVGGGKKI